MGLARTWQAVREGRIGFRMHEVMSGWHEFLPGNGPAGRLKMSFAVDWGPDRLGPWLDADGETFMTQPLSGIVTIDGLCREAPCAGMLTLRYAGEHRLRYDFTFHANDRTYRYEGQKVNVRPWNLPFSHTTCFGTLVEADTERLVSRSVTHFRLRTMPAFLASWRPVLAA